MHTDGRNVGWIILVSLDMIIDEFKFNQIIILCKDQKTLSMVKHNTAGIWIYFLNKF